MKIAIIHDFLREYGGAERVLEVLVEMFPDAPVYVSYYNAEKYPFPPKGKSIKTSFFQKLPSLWRNPNFIQKIPFLRRLIPHYSQYLYPVAFRLFDLREFDVVISSASAFCKSVRTSSRQTHICYCHTPPRHLWQNITKLKKNSLLNRTIVFFDKLLRRMDYKSAQKVDYFVANSKTVQQRIKDFYHRESVVIYPPVDLLERVSYDFRNQKIGDYYLVVSRLEKLKHIDIIVEAFTKIGFPLVVVGTGIESDYLQSLSGNSVKFAGFATDEEICRYYSECKAFIVAAEDEDFGITAVEAQLFGKGVIAPRQGGFLETIIDGETGLFFDRIEVQSLIEAVLKFEKMTFNPATIRKNAQRFSKKKFMNSLNEMVQKSVKK